MTDDDEQFQTAADRFLLEPEALTQHDLDAMRAVDDLLAERAITKRSDALVKAADARHRAAMGLPAVVQTETDLDTLADVVIDHIRLGLAKPRHEIKGLKASVATSEQRAEQRMLALEARVLELEARLAVAHVER
jgi:hypothetical protein